MNCNPENHHRRSIRLKGYDYSQEGLYFITICLQDRECLFGDTRGHQNLIFLNEAGKMAVRWYQELRKKFPDKYCREMVVMPNHIHFIIENTGDGPDGNLNQGAHVGAP